MIFNVILYSVLISAFILAVVIWNGNKKNPVNISFALLTFFGGFWALTIVMFRNASSLEAALFWDRMIYIVGSIVPCIFVYFSKIFPYTKKRVPLFEKFILVLPLLIFLFLIFFSKQFIEKVWLNNNGNDVILGKAYPFWMVWFFVFFGWSFLNLFTKYKSLSNIGKLQLKYVFVAIGFPALFCVPFNIILPFFGEYRYIWVGPIFILFMLIIIAYAISRHRLMDIRIVIRKILIHISVSLIFLIFILGSIFSVAKFLAKRIPDYKLVFTGALAMAIILLFYDPIKKFIENIINRYLFKTLYTSKQAIEELTNKTTAIIDLDELTFAIVDTIMKSMGLNRTGILLVDPGKENEPSTDMIRFFKTAKVVGFNEKNGISLVQDNFLTDWLEKNKKPLVFEELELMARDAKTPAEKEHFLHLQDNMRKIEAGLCLPLSYQNKLFGLIVLGIKISNEAYTKEDLELLETLANQASVGIQNARMYYDIQKIVDSQTSDIKQKNIQLEKMLKIQSEFLDISSHQLRTPISVIKGVSSMLAEGDMDSLSIAEKRKFYQSVYGKSLKLEKIINDILRASEFDSVKYNINSESPKISPEEVIGTAVDDAKMESEQRKIDLIWQRPSSPLPKIYCEKTYLVEAIGNLIANALKYTPSIIQVKEARNRREERGVVRVEAKKEKDDILIKVSDNGIGIPKEEIKKLFAKFARAKNATEMYTDGSGLGLFIVKEIVNGHRGKVWLESELGKGTTFYVSLPIAKK